MNKGAFAVIINNNEVLLVRSSTNSQYINHWSFPGGVVDEGESLRAAAIRESIEETGILCDPKELIVSSDNPQSDIVINIFRADYVSGDITIDPNEIEEAGWFNLNDALTMPLAYSNKAILLSLVEGSKIVH